MLINGTSTANVLTGTPSNDQIFAMGGGDTINASAGTDSIDGGAGTDTVVVSLGRSDLFAPIAGPITLTLTSSLLTDGSGQLNSSLVSVERLSLLLGDLTADVTVDATGVVSGNPLAVRAVFGNGDITYTGGNSADTVTLGLGDNVVDTGGGSDEVRSYFDSADGIATLHFTGGAVEIRVGGVVTNTISNTEFVYVGEISQSTADGALATVDASAFDPASGVQLVFLDHNGDDHFIGSAGADIFSNSFTFTIGADTYLGNGGADIYDYTVAVNALNDDVILDFDADDIIDFQFNDGIVAGQELCYLWIGSAAFSGVAGQYRYFASGGQTFIEADTDGDMVADHILTLANGQFAIGETAPGSNILNMIGMSGTAAADTLTATPGDDSIYAQGGNDIILGSQGNDFVNGGAGGGDRLFMNTGDASLFTAATAGRTYTIGASTITDSSGTLNTSFTLVERIAFSTVGNGDFDDVIDASGFVSAHSAGLDIRLGNGDNIVTGSSTNDRVFTGYGSNVIDAGTGYDFSQVNVDATTDVTVTVSNVGGVLVTDANGVVNQLTGFEEVWVFGTGSGAVTLDASGYNEIDGLALILVGHDGTDIMIGSAANDFFANITGQVSGNDVYTGNGGSDIYDYTYAADSMNGDTITDFDIDDLIDFRFNTLLPGQSPVLADHFIGAAEFSGTAGEYRYQIDGTTTVIQVDSDGDTVVDQVLTISNGGFELAETAAGSNVLTLAAVINAVEGVVADGYVAGATLFVDVNGNGVRDSGEAWTTTDASGNYDLNVNQAGTIVAVGGTNVDTGFANAMTLRATFGATVVNPLTTLVVAVSDELGIDAAAAEVAVISALGLDPSLDLMTTDLLSAGGDAALEAQQAAATVANLLTTAESVAGATSSTEADALAALANLVDGGGDVDLTDQSTIAGILGSALPTASGLDDIAAQLAAEADAISAAGSIGEIAAAQLAALLTGDDLDNVITGNDHANALSGNGGSDHLFGLGGDDTVTGGDGVDYLTGGDGDDVFVAEINATPVDSRAGPISLDVILDFSDGDSIDLSALDANALIPGNQDFRWVGSSANRTAGDLSCRTFDSINGAERALGIDIDGVSGASPYSGPVTVLLGNVDGGPPDFAIALINCSTIDTGALMF